MTDTGLDLAPATVAHDEGSSAPASWTWLVALASQAPGPRRGSAAEWVADVLRLGITEGHLKPGSRLSEKRLAGALNVSRNTLREAFRLLTHEGLLVYVLHRGVLVRELGEEDVRDVFRLRRMLELQVVRSLSGVDPEGLDRLRADMAAAEEAARERRWADVGTANMRFHQHLVGLAGSPRIDEIAERLHAELRLAFHATVQDELYRSFLGRNRELLRLLDSGDTAAAADALERYLQDSQAVLLAAYRRR